MQESWSLIKRVFSILVFFSFYFFINVDFLFAGENATITAIVSISICGNGVVEGGEVCDMNNLNNFTIEDFGYDDGELKCSISCDEFDFSDCSNTSEEIELKTEVSSEKTVLVENDKKEEVRNEDKNIRFENNHEEIAVLNGDTISVNNIAFEENKISENKLFEFEELILTQDFTSRAPP